MPTMDVFNSNAFSTISLTNAVEKVPYLPSLLGDLGIYDPVPVRTQTVEVEERSGVLSLIQTTPRGAPMRERTTEKRNMRNFSTQRLAEGSTIRADEIQNIRAFGSETELMQVQDEVMRRLNGPT